MAKEKTKEIHISKQKTIISTSADELDAKANEWLREMAIKGIVPMNGKAGSHCVVDQQNNSSYECFYVVYYWLEKETVNL